MSDRRVINLEPGHIDLSWDGDEPVLELAEYRGDRTIIVRVKVGRYVARAIACHLHEIAKRYAARAADLLKSLKGGEV